jgi:hypothetical protein
MKKNQECQMWFGKPMELLLLEFFRLFAYILAHSIFNSMTFQLRCEAQSSKFEPILWWHRTTKTSKIVT